MGDFTQKNLQSSINVECLAPFEPLSPSIEPILCTGLFINTKYPRSLDKLFEIV